MLVQALADYANRRLSKQLADLTFEDREVPYLLKINSDGTFAGITERLRTSPTSGRIRVRRFENLAVPKSPVHRNTGIHPLLACDSIRYVLGVGTWTRSERENGDLERHRAFTKLIDLAASETADPVLKACSVFYQRPNQVDAARAEFDKTGILPGRLVALFLNGPVVSVPGVREFWRQHYWRVFEQHVAKGGEGRCLVCGRSGPIAPTHDKINHLSTLGGLSSGTALMSADKDSFRSYGWYKTRNSPVCPPDAAAYVLALNDLLRPSSRSHVRHGSVAFVFWAEKELDRVDPVALIENPIPAELAALTTLAETLRAQQNEFYLAAVSCNGGRLIIRCFIRDQLNRVLQHIREWFEDLAIINAFTGILAPCPNFDEILSAVSGGEAAPYFTVAVVERALQGKALGVSVLTAALEQTRKSMGTARISPIRASLIRMCLKDRQVLMDDALNPDLKAPAYLWGRLLAIYETVMHNHDESSGTRFTDQHYAPASCYPGPYLRRLDDRCREALQKLLLRVKCGAGVALYGEISQLRERLATAGEAARRPLGLEDQGRFALGYYHQKAENVRQARALQTTG